MTAHLRDHGLIGGPETARRPTGPVLVLVVVLVVHAIGPPLLRVLVGVTGVLPGSLAWQLILTVPVFGIRLLLLYGWVRFKEGRPFSTLGFRSRPIGRPVALGAAAGLVMVGAVALAELGTGQATSTAAPVTVALTGTVLLALVGFAVQGSTEEILYRGYLLPGVARRWGPVAGVAVQAVVFAGSHGANPGGIELLPLLNLLLFGLFLAGWALLEGGLWGVCAWHAVWNWAEGNVWGMAVSGLPVESTLLHVDTTAGASALVGGGAFGPEGGLVTTVVLTAGIAVLSVLHRRRRER